MQLEGQMEALKCKLALMAKAYCKQPLSISERSLVNTIVMEFS